MPDTRNTSKYRLFTKAASFILALVMLFYVLPLTVFASDSADGAAEDTSGASSEAYSSSLDTENTYEYPELKRDIYEVEALRTESSKTFRLPDGSYTVAQYRYPVHELDESGEWQDINSTLAESAADFVTSNARVKFSKKISGNEGIFTLHEGNGKINLALDGAIKKTEGVVYNGTDEGGTELQKMLSLNELTSRIVYADILNGVDLEYLLLGKSIKENIIVRERSAGNSFSFTLSLNNLTAALTEDGAVLITRPDGSAAYTIPSPIVYDSEGSYAPKNASAYTLTGGKNGKYTLTVSVSAEWMNDADIVYPVTVDPTISTPSANILDTYVYPSTYSPNSSHENESELTVSDTIVAYVKVSTLPTLPKNAYITEAKMHLTQEFPVNLWDMYVGAYAVTSDWAENLTYNQYLAGAGAYSQTPIDYAVITTMGADTYSWDITELARGWYSGTPNHGVAFKAIEDAGFEIYIKSQESTYEYQRPHFTVSYRDMKGVESYYSYSSQSAGVAGAGSVNLANGKLSFAIPLLSTTDSLMPTSLSAVYNSDLAGKSVSLESSDYAYTESFMPKGFKLNISETLLKNSYVDTEGQTVNYYILSDADGSEHAFLPVKTAYGYSSYEFVDEDGLRLALNVLEPEITITDNARTVKEFIPFNGASEDTRYYLSEIRDVHGNRISFGFGEGNRPILVSLIPKGSTRIDFLTLNYTNGILSSVRNESANRTVTLSCDTSGNLTGVTFDFGSGNPHLGASYTYDGGRLIRATDTSTGYSVEYTYTIDKVTAIKELANGSLGQSLGISYYGSYTSLRASGSNDAYGDSDDIITNYVLDSHGRAVSVYSTDTTGKELLGASYGEYEEQENVKNNLKKSAVSGGSQTNYLINGDFSDFEQWNASSGIYSHSDVSGNYYCEIPITVGMTRYISQTVTLPIGKYTLNADLGFFNTLNSTVLLKVKRGGEEEAFATQEIPVSYIYTTKNESSLTFDVETEGEYTVVLEVTGKSTHTGNGNITVYGFALTKNVGASKASLVEAGHLTTVNPTYPANSFWKDKNGNSAILVTDSFGEAIKVTGSVSSESYVKQVIYTADEGFLGGFGYWDFTTNGEKTYMLAAMVKAPNAVANPNAKARVRVEVRYYQGDGNGDIVEHFDFDLDKSADGWQFVTGDFNTNGDVVPLGDDICVKEISVICEYSNQPAGYALFDEISVVECTGASIVEYGYHENGLLAIAKDFYYTETYEYDALKRPTYVYTQATYGANGKGEYTEYIYDGENLTYEISGSFEEMPQFTNYTAERMHEYSYNTYGQCTYDLYGEVTYDSGTGDVVVSQYYSPAVLKSTSYETTAGSKIFGATLTTNDGTGRRYRYYYNENNGQLLAEINVTDGIGTAYSYDAYGNLVAVKPATYVSATAYATVENAEGVDYTYNPKLQLNEINTDSTEYTLTYDAFGNTSSISAGNNTLASYEYGAYNGKLNKLNYGNGHTVEYEYDTLDNISKIKYNGVDAYEYTYTKDGSIYEVEDLRNQRSVRYEYDTAGRVIGIVDADTAADVNEAYTLISYTTKNELNAVTVSLYPTHNSVTAQSQTFHSYDYAPDGRLEKVHISGGGVNGDVLYSYDALERVSGKSYSYTKSGNTYTNTTSYEYTSTAEHYGYTNELVTGYTSTVGTSTKAYSYEYDARSNITSVSINGTEKFRYVYDDLNQLVREDNVDKNATFVYNYDTSGNILSVKTYLLTAEGVTPSGGYMLTSYGYSSDGWGDKLTSFNGQAISYDSIGNPLTYYNGSSYSFTWQGRQLVGATKGNKTMSFEYNADGIRTSKTVNGVTTKYYLNGSQIVAEVNPNYSIMYIYDADGAPIGMQYRASSYAENVFDYYFFEKNLQGDIVAVYGADGTKYLEYFYDAWGNFQIGYHNAGNLTPAALNPFAYRGYYYDSDLNLYYLNSRYYDSNVRRFISPDTVEVLNATPMSLTDKNLYAYCDNNPITRVDNGGEFWLIKALVGVAVQYVEDVVDNIRDGKKGVDILKPKSSVGTYISSGVTALIPGSGFGANLFRSAVSETISIAEKSIEGEKIDFCDSILNIADNTLFNYSFSYIGSKVSQKIKSNAPVNYSSYANQQYKKNANISPNQIREKMAKAIRANDFLSISSNFFITTVPSLFR